MFVLDAVTIVEDEVRELVRRRGLDPVVDGAAIHRLVEDVVADYEERTLTSALPAIADVRSLTRRVYDAVAGFGPLQAYLDDPTIEEIWVNEPGRVFVARRGRNPGARAGHHLRRSLRAQDSIARRRVDADAAVQPRRQRRGAPAPSRQRSAAHAA